MEDGVAVKTVDDIRWLRCDIKSLNLLANVLAKQEAFESGCAEAILVRDGIVMEGSSSNAFRCQGWGSHNSSGNESNLERNHPPSRIEAL